MYDYPAEHRQHIRTTNPIESVFATVRHRTQRTKGCLIHAAAMIPVFKLVDEAAKTWRRLNGNNRLRELILGVTFRDGISDQQNPHNHRRLNPHHHNIDHSS